MSDVRQDATSGSTEQRARESLRLIGDSYSEGRETLVASSTDASLDPVFETVESAPPKLLSEGKANRPIKQVAVHVDEFPMGSSTRGVTILLAEDDPDLQLLARLMLERRGYEVAAVSNGRAALESAAAHAPDVAVLDIAMPEIDGLALTELLRASAATSNTSIILLSADVQPSVIEAALRRGASAFVKKPFKAAELLEAVEAALAA